MTKTSLCCCAARASKVCRRGPTANACLSGRQKSAHHWAHPVRYCSTKFTLSCCCTAPPRMSFRGGAKPRRGNLQHGSMMKYEPINIEYPKFTMLIGCFRIRPRSRRLPRPFGPRNDSGSRQLSAKNQQCDKHQFNLDKKKPPCGSTEVYIIFNYRPLM